MTDKCIRFLTFSGSRPPSLIGSTATHSSPSGCLGTHRLPSILTPSTSGWFITCKACHKPTVFPDEQTVMLMPINNALVNVIKRYFGKKKNHYFAVLSLLHILPGLS